MKLKNYSNNFISQIAYEYSNLRNSYSQSYFCYKYNLTRYIFRKMIEKAITNLLIDDEACLRIREKATSNIRSYGGNQAMYENCYLKYVELFKQRAYFAKSHNMDTIFIELISPKVKEKETEDSLRNKIEYLKHLLQNSDFLIESDELNISAIKKELENCEARYDKYYKK